MKPTWKVGDVVTTDTNDGIFIKGEELVVVSSPGQYVTRDGLQSTRKGSTVLSRPKNAGDANGMHHYWVDDEHIVVPEVTKEELDEVIQRILGSP